MPRRSDTDTSYGLEHQLSKSIERMRENITRSHALRREIIRLRRERKQIQSVPDEVRQWFEDVEEFEDEE